MTDRDEYFHRLDALVGEAERLGIGLIPSFFWQHGAVPDVVGESVDQWGNADSKTYTVMREYVRAVVDRYKMSPAMWGWEFGNEFRLYVDLPGPERGFPHVAPKAGTPATRTANDILQRSAVERAQAEFARLVRRIDRQRILVTGDSRPRSCAHHLHTEGAWKRDTPTQWKAMLLGDNADPYDTISIHCYPSADEVYFEPSVSLTGLLGVCQDAAKNAGKPLFVGEFGASSELGAEQARQYVDEMLDAIVALRIPLAAMWVYDLPSQDGSYNITPDNDRAWMLEAIRRTNQRLQGNGPIGTAPALD